MYYKNDERFNDIRSSREISFVCKTFEASSSNQEDQRSTGEDYIKEQYLADRCKIPPELPQERQKAWSQAATQVPLKCSLNTVIIIVEVVNIVYSILY